MTRVLGGFWAQRMEINRRATLPIQYRQCRDTGRLAAWNLDWKPGNPHPPHIFWDSDVAKWIETAAYSLADHPDPVLKRRVRTIIAVIARAQQPDGYLNSHFIAVEPDRRWTNLRDQHELYCAGHLAEAAVAWHEATGDRRLLDVLCRYMDHIDRVFGPRPGQKRGYPGHPEIELALVKLHRATGEPRYLQLARYFVLERGRFPHYFDQEARERGEKPGSTHYAYTQAHQSVLRQTEVVGHAVRAMYLYAGMADVAAETGDTALRKAGQRLWQNLVRKRLHITGGIGPTHANEGFTRDYDLPAETAYLETCAAIGLILWAWRLLRADLNGEYGDVMERALFNGALSGVAADGQSFFYGNPLAASPGFDGNGRFIGPDYHYRRSPWFGCACCPPNIARLIAQFPRFLYAPLPGGLAVHHYAASAGDFAVAGQKVQITQKTDYPWKGRIRLSIRPEKPAVWTLALRIPGWCRNPGLLVNGQAVAPSAVTRRGYARLTREWRAGDRVLLTLPMPVERIECHPAARQNAGRVALQRGPVVYALEEADNGPRLNDLALDAQPRFTLTPGRAGILAGVPLIRARASRRPLTDWRHLLYRPLAPARRATSRLTAIPYFLWANRAPGEMLVWIRHHPV